MAQEQVDIVVVGAGLSGLQAANLIQKSGRSCVVLEALPRIGGRTCSVQSSDNGKGSNDLAATWINDSSQSEMYKLAQRFSLDLEPQLTEGESLFSPMEDLVIPHPYGIEPMSDEDRLAFERLMQIVHELCEDPDILPPFNSPKARSLDEITLQQFTEKELPVPTILLLTKLLARTLLGVEADEVSLLYMLHYFKSGTGLANVISDHKDGAQHLRVRKGTQSFSQHLAQELKPGSVRLSTPVVSINQSDTDECIVSTTAGSEIHCKKVVVSVPSYLYSSIDFSPPLPEGKQLYADSTIDGYYTKLIYVFDTPWWRTAGLSGVFISDAGPIVMTRDTSVPADDQWSLSAFILGEPGRKWSRLSKTQRRAQAWQQLSKAFGQHPGVGDIPQPINVLEQEWKKESYLSAPCPVTPPGALSAYGDAISSPFRNIHFVGSELAEVWKGYMEGAVRSGQQGAAEVVKALHSKG